MGEAVGGVFRVPDGDLLEPLDPPEIAVLADRTQVEAGDPKRLRADLGVPAVEAAEVQVRGTVRQPAGFDRVRVVDEEQEDVPIARIERRRLGRDLHVRVVPHRRPIERPGYLPAGVAGAVAGDAPHGPDELVIVDPAVIRSGYGAQLDPAVRRLEELDLLRTM